MNEINEEEEKPKVVLELSERLEQIRVAAFSLQKLVREISPEEKASLVAQGIHGQHRKYVRRNCWEFIFALNRMRYGTPWTPPQENKKKDSTSQPSPA